MYNKCNNNVKPIKRSLCFWNCEYFMSSVYEKWAFYWEHRRIFLEHFFVRVRAIEWYFTFSDFLLLTFPPEFLSVCICRDCSLNSKSTYVSEMFWSQDSVYLPSDKLSYYIRNLFAKTRVWKKGWLFRSIL